MIWRCLHLRFPLIFDLQEVGSFTRDDMGSLAPAPFNSFSHASKLADPSDKFVSINNETVYSIAQIDVSDDPVLLSVPDPAGRYYVLQFVDAWTDNFAYVGRRATGTAAGSFLLTPPGWQDDAPGGEEGHRVPTKWARSWAAGRAMAHLTWARSGPCRPG